ncbi:hypothetical protein GN956_G19434 [Arapaima gigas]
MMPWMGNILEDDSLFSCVAQRHKLDGVNMPTKSIEKWRPLAAAGVTAPPVEPVALCQRVPLAWPSGRDITAGWQP